MARKVKHVPSWDKRQNPASSCEDALDTLSQRSLVQGVRGLSFVLYEIADSPYVTGDDELDVRYVAERIELYMTALLQTLNLKKSVNRQAQIAKERTGKSPTKRKKNAKD